MTGVAEQPDELRVAIGEVGALATLATAAYDGTDWSKPDPAVVDGIGNLLRRISKSATVARTALYRRHGAVADAQPAPAGDRRDGEGATSGEGDLSAQDADIIQRIRERCPDGRFDGGSDAELIQLFKRNKQVLSRTDDDVIAAMTHQK